MGLAIIIPHVQIPIFLTTALLEILEAKHIIVIIIVIHSRDVY